MGKIGTMNKLAKQILQNMYESSVKITECESGWVATGEAADAVAWRAPARIGYATIEITAVKRGRVKVWLWMDGVKYDKIYGQSFDSLAALQRASVDAMGLQFATMLARYINKSIRAGDRAVDKFLGDKQRAAA